MPANDLWIAASCVVYGAVLFSLDAHCVRLVPSLAPVPQLERRGGRGD
jgi:hypothetical protein